METNQLIYVGPNLRSRELQSYQIFIGGVPKYLEPLIEKRPEIGKLFVPVDGLNEALRELNTIGTPLNKYYKEANK